jgi:Family of unknown function (DUF5670)
MKRKITQSIAALIIVTLILSSCGTSTSITKRRYNKGYYLSHSHKKHINTKNDRELSVAVLKPTARILKINENKPVNTTSIKKPQPIISAGANKIALKQKPQNISKKINGTYQAKNSEVPVELTEQQRFKTVDTEVVQRHSDGNSGLSLFWIVILILLILFAFGAINGSLGGLIYLLLVVALILFILWLLRII